MGYWNSKVVPRFKKIFEKNSAKKAAAAEACKTFDESKVHIIISVIVLYANYIAIGPMRRHYLVINL